MFPREHVTVACEGMQLFDLHIKQFGPVGPKLGVQAIGIWTKLYGKSIEFCLNPRLSH